MIKELEMALNGIVAMLYVIDILYYTIIGDGREIVVANHRIVYFTSYSAVLLTGIPFVVIPSTITLITDELSALK
jgi:hypothetical protein